MVPPPTRPQLQRWQHAARAFLRRRGVWRQDQDDALHDLCVVWLETGADWGQYSTRTFQWAWYRVLDRRLPRHTPWGQPYERRVRQAPPVPQGLLFDHAAGPGSLDDVACQEWLRQWPPAYQRLARALLAGVALHEHAAQEGCTPAAISYRRRQLQAAWRQT